ncbi:hypothetical protein RB195_005296 [Necator americanus]|uniref:Uncharacterized protein n=1 Tax=Necator americanus TaxID=51031 RepID=A0ABR1BNR2_NECAM
MPTTSAQSAACYKCEYHHHLCFKIAPTTDNSSTNRRPHKPTSPQNQRQHNDERVTHNTHSRPRSRSNTRNEQSQIRHPIRTTHHAHLSDGTPEHNKQDTVGEFQEPSSSYTVTVTSNNDNHDDIHQGNSILLMYTKVTLMNPEDNSQSCSWTADHLIHISQRTSPPNWNSAKSNQRISPFTHLERVIPRRYHHSSTRFNSNLKTTLHTRFPHNH